LNSEDIDGITETEFQRGQAGKRITTYGLPPGLLEGVRWFSKSGRKSRYYTLFKDWRDKLLRGVD